MFLTIGELYYSRLNDQVGGGSPDTNAAGWYNYKLPDSLNNTVTTDKQYNAGENFIVTTTGYDDSLYNFAAYHSGIRIPIVSYGVESFTIGGPLDNGDVIYWDAFGK